MKTATAMSGYCWCAAVIRPIIIRSLILHRVSTVIRWGENVPVHFSELMNGV